MVTQTSPMKKIVQGVVRHYVSRSSKAARVCGGTGTSAIDCIRNDGLSPRVRGNLS